ncbi:MAG: hypothetical protein ABI868_11215 [Acidobacteriota bacterium]
MFKKHNCSRVGVGGLVAAALALWWGCGSPTAPSTVRASGAWVGNSTLVSVNGGECVGATLQPLIGARDIFTTALKQSGSALEATVASAAHGTNCAYSGAVDGSGAVTLTLASCQTDRTLAVRCDSGALRDVQLVAGSIRAALDTATSGSGTDTSTWKVLNPGDTAAVGSLTVTARFAWTFLGLPSSDYHVFTGTIFPGYADGTMSIESTETFCLPCGWFLH